MAQYERKNLRYIHGLDDEDPDVKLYDKLCRYISYVAAILVIFGLRHSGILTKLPAAVSVIILVLLLFAVMLGVDFLLQKFIFGPLAVKKTQHRSE